jgi:hypothetical protein
MNRIVRSGVVAGTLAAGMLGACATTSGLESYSTDASIGAANRGMDGASDV